MMHDDDVGVLRVVAMSTSTAQVPVPFECHRPRRVVLDAADRPARHRPMAPAGTLGDARLVRRPTIHAATARPVPAARTQRRPHSVTSYMERIRTQPIRTARTDANLDQ